jgi:uncharacterized membrane protein YhhN
VNPALAVAALAALATIAAAPWALGLPALPFATKPLATLALIAFAWPRGRNEPARRHWLLAGLWCSLAGDVALLWPQGFVAGLVAFLLGHLAYLVALTRDTAFARPAWPFGLYALVATGVLAFLWPGLPMGLRAAVIAYVLALGTMAGQALARWRTLEGAGAGTPAAALARRAALGAALFMSSDALLAIDRFATPLPMASLWILSTYWLAQAALAGSLAPPRPAGTPHLAAKQ